MVIVAGEPLRAERVQLTEVVFVVQLPLVALAPRISSWLLISSWTVIERGELLLLNTEIE
jgi:hypothetical protein